MGNSRSRCMHGLGPLSSACMAVVCKEMNVASDHRLGQGPQMGKEKKSRALPIGGCNLQLHPLL